MNTVHIRPFIISDKIAIAKIFIDSFSEKFGKLPKINPDKFNSMIFDTMVPIHGNIVAELNGEIVGLLYLKSQHIPKHKINWIHFIQKYGLINSFHFLLTTFILNFHRVKRDECYISFIGLSPKARGKGIGTKLIEYGEKGTLKYNYIKKYTLFVWEGNKGAYNLYQRLGFKKIKKIKLPLLKLITGYSTAIFMVKHLI